ncbi:PREDICTED: NSFL1 cofactor p47 [Aptenodytes forsteri]|uniref:NSFL1 cofactor p47 n=1 Tax=Aptenodytes forsteri TaxID=9233 RepID=UPI0004F46EA5|nr:PREDICTED: NSFL1 cofactor p47 [Aptenodytes forsteri]
MAPATTRALPLACLMPLLLQRAPGAGAQAGQGFEVQQPQDKVSVTAGETLNLTCTMSGGGSAGAVRWLKGLGSGNETVYEQKGSFPRVTRAVSESDTDFSIHIRDVRPEDAGTYYCVKFKKSLLGGDEVFRRGNGTEVSIALASFYEDGGDEDILTLPQPAPSSISRGTAASDHRVTSFRDLVHAQEDDDEEEEGQRFYAGGSERSGQQIVGPPRKKSPNELVEDLFKGAKEHGAVAVDRAAKSSGETSKPKPFAGGGYRLGATPEEESAYVAGERRQNSAQDVHVVLKLWKSGFSLDSGELRSYQDPSNAQFLDDIRRGEVPAELRRLARGGQVNLDMEDHRDEEYVKPKSVFKAFTGEGQKLGSTAPQVMGTSSPAQQAENEAKASSAIAIDESEPITNIQIRLADGGRLVQKFNHNHRIRDIRLFIVDARPAMAATSFVLMTTFPNKELTDENQTLKEANLLNAVIVQRLT